MSGAEINGEPLSDEGYAPSKTFIIKDTNTPKSVKIEFDQPTELFTYITKTLSQSESGADLTDQGICLLIPFRMQGGLNVKGKLEII
jgi:hypothetical protein